MGEFGTTAFNLLRLLGIPARGLMESAGLHPSDALVLTLMVGIVVLIGALISLAAERRVVPGLARPTRGLSLIWLVAAVVLIAVAIGGSAIGTG
jgi:hypothetical protein